MNFEHYGLSNHPAVIPSEETAMKRKSGKAMVDFDKKVSVVHFNVGSGYLTYLEEETPNGVPRLKSITIPQRDED